MPGAQYVATTSNFAHLSSGSEPAPAGSSGKADRNGPKMKSLAEFLDTLPTSSVGQKHSAVFECDLDEDPDKFKVSKHARTPTLGPNCGAAPD